MMNLLRIDASASGDKSVTRQLTEKIQKVQEDRHGDLNVTQIDLNEMELPFLSPDMIASYFTPEEKRSDDQKGIIKISDEIVSEWKKADIIILGVPMYNFGLPGKLKTYFDQLARVGETFHYGESGPVGHLKGKKVYIGVATGGTPIGSPYDHVTPYLKTFLAFLGMEELSIVSIDKRGDINELMSEAHQEIVSWQ